MPVSHIGLTVSHLPTSTSFFLAALQPLGYRYIGQSGNQIGFGIREADFFICQETPGVRAGAAHIAFTAPSTAAVRNFYTAALNAGGRPNGSPATRCDEDNHFNAAVLDFDGNSIEVVFRNQPDFRDDGTVIEHSRVITWQRTVAESYHDDRSVVSLRTSASKPPPTEILSKAASIISKAPSVASKPASVARSVSAPVTIPQTPNGPDAGDGAAKKIIGTLLGAAAGAAVAYAMVRSEQDSAKKEADFSAFMDAKNIVKAAVGHFAQAPPQPVLPTPDPQPTYSQYDAGSPTPQSVHRQIDAQSYHSSTPPLAQSVYAQRQIEAPPPSYHSPTYSSVPPTQIVETRALEYVPAISIAPSQARTRFSAHRSFTNPELLTVEKARSVASTSKPQSVVSMSKPQSVAHSAAPSSLISSFVPEQVTRRSSEGSVHSHRSSRSKAKSSHTDASRHTSHSKHSSSSRREAIASPPSPPAPSKVGSKADSLVGSILGRSAKSTASKHKDFIDDFEIEELTEDDLDTVVPSDSISNAGSSSRRHRNHRSKKHDDESGVSKHSSTSKHSKHSHRSHRSHKSRSHDDSEHSDTTEHTAKSRRSHRPSVISEPSDASTVKPIKTSSRAGSRKDSLTHGQYDGLFDEVQYGSGDVMPIRGITPSMVSAAGKNKTRTMTNFAHMQRMRAFEGQ